MRLLARGMVGLCFITLVLSIMAFAQDSDQTITRSSLPPPGKLLSLVRWRVVGKEGHLLCVVSQERANASGPSLPTRVLTIYREDGDKLIRIYKFESPDSVLNTYPLGDYNARLFVTWVGGSAYHLRVLAFMDGRVKQVLEEGSKLSPEFLYDDQGRESVLVTEPTFENGKWTATNGTTTVFKWNGQSYDNLGTVPWAKRLQCLSKESCASLK